MSDIPWGPSGETVYSRTYARTKPDGTKETWPETVERVVKGNFGLVYGEVETWPTEVAKEAWELDKLMCDFKVLPAGRHLWASGVKGRQYLFNCWTAGWGEKLSDHFEFTFLRLMEGGGVGANYSSRFLQQYGAPRRQLNVHIVCDPEHPDYAEMQEQGLLSTEYTSDWEGAWEVEDSREGWAAALVDLIDTYMTDEEVKHENRVYDVTNVRAKGARLKTFGGTASGPGPFARMMANVGDVLNVAYTSPAFDLHHLSPLDAMEIDHAIAECVVSGGNRRSARMSMVDWDDPFIMPFINCKKDTGKHWTTNISVAIDDKYIEESWLPALGTHAVAVHDAVTRAMLRNGEPGFFNASLANKGELEPVYTTNPCGEITLQQWEACNLGHVNLDAFAPTEAGGEFDWEGLTRAHELMARFLVRATFADINDPKSIEIQNKNRRIGVGHLGVQAFLAKCGVRFSEAPDATWFIDELAQLRGVVRLAADRMAFELRIPAPVKVTTVAPTGSVAKLPGTTEGIHPIYARYFERRIRFSMADPEQLHTVMRAEADGLTVEVDKYDRSGNTMVVVYPTKDPLVEQVEAMGLDPDIVESADELTLEQMLSFQSMYQTWWADNAVSFTVNVQPSLGALELSQSLRRHLPELKGTTIMPDDSRPQAPYTRITQEEYEASQVKTIEDAIDLECAGGGACPIR